MSRSVLIGGLFVGILVVGSMIAPAPAALAEQRHSGSGSTSSGGPGGGSGSGSGESPACNGLRNAYDACTYNNGNHSGCAHIFEQMMAHGCHRGSNSGISF